ncbi:hypothetical protein [Halobacillus halophilus]|uniref:hypothetical protein n=1 Tax=Halobacillus halophilus TaxID=1570 RepID=UPI001CD57145|nr:hypothetical protein [Halobacillus halophilus]MCA1009848.1 hypothetical protein [Halobacillus halophilus]
MKRQNVQWLPVIASIGVGAATYSLMTGQSGQLQNVLPGLAKVASSPQKNQSTEQFPFSG